MHNSLGRQDATQFSYHGAEKNIDLINHDAWNLYQIAKVYLAEYDKLAYVQHHTQQHHDTGQ
jgi:hypothetical protein